MKRTAWALAFALTGCLCPSETAGVVDGICLPGFTDACNISKDPSALDYYVICFNLQNDPNACGACGNICDSGVCIDGTCAPPLEPADAGPSDACPPPDGQACDGGGP